MSWTDRKSIKIAEEKVYFFGKSLAGINQQLKSVFNNYAVKTEKEIGVEYTDTFTTLSENIGSVDPLFNYLFHSKPNEKLTPAMLDEILDFNKPQSLDNETVIRYVDLALILGRENKALEFVEAHKLDIDVINVLNQNKAIPEICGEQVQYYKALSNFSFLKKNAPNNLREAVSLTTCIADMLISIMGKQYGVTELWKQGYCWDAFVLCRLTTSLKFRDMFTPLVLPSLCNRLSALQLLCDINQADKQMMNIRLLSAIGSVLSYRILKCTFSHQEKNLVDMEEIVSARMDISTALQEILINCLCLGEYDQCKEILNDFFGTVSMHILGDMFYGLEKIYFKKTMEFVASVSELVNHAQSFVQSKLLKQIPPSPNGLLATFLKFWLDSEMYQQGNNEHRVAATRGILYKLYAIAKKNNYKNGALVIALAYCITTSSECNLYKSVSSLGVSEENATNFITALRSDLTKSNTDQNLTDVFRKIDRSLFTEESDVNIFTTLDSRCGDLLDSIGLTLESILRDRSCVLANENTGRASPADVEKTNTSSRCSSVGGFNQTVNHFSYESTDQIYSKGNVTDNVSSGRGSSLSQDNVVSNGDGFESRRPSEWAEFRRVSESDSRRQSECKGSSEAESESAARSAYRTGGFGNACNHTGFKSEISAQ
ncbi:unnamed protein product [Auanema sp. JU1783]|nr:unnamed protein product [Auanema sp. JU1783]